MIEESVDCGCGRCPGCGVVVHGRDVGSFSDGLKFSLVVSVTSESGS